MSSTLPLIPRYFINSIEKWADKRQTGSSSSAIIDRHHLYILPTKAGLVFFLTLLIIFIGAVNYENNMAFLLCFILVSISLLSIFFTHQNINRLKIKTSATRAVFLGQSIYFPIELKHENSQSSFCLYLEGDKNKSIFISTLSNNEATTILLPIKSLKRGKQKLPRIKIHSEYPFSLFYAWSWVKLSASCLIYPKPEKNISKIISSNYSTAEQSLNKKPGHDDFNSLRNYTEGDLPSHIAWKTYARNQVLYTKIFESSSHQEIMIDWFNLPPNLTTEIKLSILCQQVINAHQQDICYGMILPNKKIESSHGASHRHQCLQALALFTL